AEALHEPAFLVLGPIAGAGHGAGMSYSSRQFRFPTANDAGDDRFAEFDSMLVIAAGLSIEHRGLAADVVVEGVREVPGCIMDVDVLAGRDERGGAPAFGAQILRDRGGEAPGVRENRNRSLEQYFLGIVPAERAADAHPIPGIRDAQAVGAEYVDAVCLAQRPDLARVVHRDFLGNHHDLLEFRVNAHELCNTVANT